MTGAERRKRLAGARVCLIVSEAACRGPWLDAVRRALTSGAIGLVQLREKEIDDDDFLARAASLRALLGDDGPLLILNDRVHLVAEARADGVHLGDDDMDLAEARALLGVHRGIGVSAHDAAEIAAATAAGADYVGLGPCFPTSTKHLTRPPRGAALVREAAGAAIPVFSIGGITPENVASLAAAGATRVAVGAGILSAPDPAAAALAIHRALRPAR